MILNQIKVAIRNFRRQPFFSAINIAGLGIGLAACWLLVLYVHHEHSFDHFLPDSDRICAVALDLKMGDSEAQTTNTPPPLGLRLASDFPEIEMAARSFNLGTVVVKTTETAKTPLVFNEENAWAVDPNYLALFGFPMREGDASTALLRPGSMVITERIAQQYFANESAMGKSLSINDRLFTVAGIVKNLPHNSTVQFDFLLPSIDFKVIDRFSWSWIWLQMDTWVRLKTPAQPAYIASLESKFPAMVHNYAPAAFERVGQNFEAQLQRGDRYNVKLLPLKSLHLGAANLESRLTTLGDGDQVRIFAIAGAFILVLACVNFMNLTTARSMKRAREVGVRKTLGSRRNTLITQFLIESLLISLAAMALATVLVTIVRPQMNLLTGLEWSIKDLFTGPAFFLIAILPLVTGIVGGLYPAFYLSRFSPFEAFKLSKFTGKGGHSRLRGGLVVFQFAVSIALMLGAWTVFRQLDYAQSQLPGLQRENVLTIDNGRHFPNQEAIDGFRQDLLQLPEVEEASHATYLPSIGSFGDFYEPEQGDQENSVVQNLPISSYLTDAFFVPALGIEIIEGRNFLPQSPADSNAVILNETAVKAIGWQNPIGKWLRYPGNANQRFQVVGIMRDFHSFSVRNPIEATALFHHASKTYQTWGSWMAVRLKPGTEKNALVKAREIWQKRVPGAPFASDFLDASFARLYRTEAKTGAVLGVFTAIALFIGSLGLFALAAFTAEQRTKEIGIRKVLGASVLQITRALAAGFLQLVLIAIGIATPVAYWLMNKWLANFEYRIEVSWWMFAVVGLVSILIALLTVSFQSLKAAMTNPVTTLKSE